MASGPKVSVILELLDRMTAPMNGAASTVKGFGAKLKSLGAEAMDLMRNKLFQGIGLAGLIGMMKSSVAAANEMAASIRMLAGTAKITGVPLEDLQQIAARAKDAFKLSGVQANQFAVEMAKLAEKAGDVGLAGPALQAFLDIGAARGLTAGETLKAVQQAILGIDEGTDKLFNANPSVLYKEFAESIGTTAAKLTDQQKAQALLTAAMEDGQTVQGAYAAYLDSAAGKQEQLAIAVQEASIAFGESLLPALMSLAPAAATAAGGVGLAVKVVQQFGATLGVVLFSLFDGLAGFATALMKVVTLDFRGAFEAAKSAMTNIRNNVAGGWLSTQEIWASGAKSVTGTEMDFQGLLTRLRRDGTQQRNEADKKAAEELERRLTAVHEEIAVRELMYQEGLTEAQAKALRQRQRDLGEATDVTVRTVAEGIGRLDGLNTLLAAGFDKKVTPAMRGFRTEVEQLPMMAQSVPPMVDAFDRLAEVSGLTREEVEALTASGKVYDREAQKWVESTGQAGDGFLETARSAADAAHGLGILDEKGKGIVGTMLNVGTAIKDAIAGGWSAGGIIGVVAGVGSLLKSAFGGKSPAQIEAERVLKRNTQTIEENSRRVGDLTRLNSSGAKLVGVQGVLEDAGIKDLMSRLGGASGQVANLLQGALRQTLAQQLGKLGMGIGDLDEVAKDLGVTIKNSEGKFLVQGLRDLLKMLGEIEPTQFAQTFAGQREQLRSETDLFDLSEAEQARRLLGIAGGSTGASIIGERLGGLDFDTTEGRAAAIAAIQQLFKDLPGLSAGDLGNLTGSDFLDVLSDLKDLLSGEAVAGADLGEDPEDPPVAEDPGLDLGSDPAPVAGEVVGFSLAELLPPLERAEGFLAGIAEDTAGIAAWRGPDGATGKGERWGGVKVEFHGGIQVQSGGPDGSRIGADIARGISEALAEELMLQRLARGSAER